jgi:hypothetical protein
LVKGLRGVENSAAAKGLLAVRRHPEGHRQILARTWRLNDFQRPVQPHDGRGFRRAAGGDSRSSAWRGKANSIADLLTQAGNAKASGYIGQANAFSQGLGNLASILTSIPGMH